jgi:stearoyl-CoA desaturase (delta-9 desaturase)
MMWETKHQYTAFVHGTAAPEARFLGYVPLWPELDRFADSNVSRIAFGTAYTLVYIAFAPHWAWFLLLPIHYLMGPIHGAIVNWAGHKYGYRNFNTRDKSRNVLPWDVLTLGECFQNNHHRHAQSVNFAQRAFEWDPTYNFIRVLGVLGIADRSAKAQLQDQDSPLVDVPAVPALTGTAVVAETSAAL